MKQRLYEILEKAEDGDTISKVVDVSIIVLIMINVVAVILESVPAYEQQYGTAFFYLEFFSVVIFSIEYLLRMWTITIDPKYSHPVGGRIRYFFSFGALIDLFAVLPFYLPLAVTLDSRVLRALRILRLFRVLKFGRYTKAVKLIGRVLREKREELLVSLAIAMILLVLASCFMYYAEHDHPDNIANGHFTSIPDTMWWGVATLTTVGYGDVYPLTDIGRFMAGIMAILGVGIFAIPAGILANGFATAVEKRGKEKENTAKPAICQHCQKPLNIDVQPNDNA